MSAVIKISDMQFSWPSQEGLLSIDDFELRAGEKVFLYGPSGCGKSTLLNLVGGVITPTHGEIELLQKPFSVRSSRYRDAARAEHISFIFQIFNLLPYLSVIENVVLPCRFSAKRRKVACAIDGSLDEGAKRLLQALGLERELWRQPVSLLSVGQQQRVAAARALIGCPALIIADEPTSALDIEARSKFIELLMLEVGRSGSSLLFVSHDTSLAAMFDRSQSIADLASIGALN